MEPESYLLLTERHFFAALVDSSSDALDRLLTDDFTLIDVMKGDEISKAAFLDALQSGLLHFDRIEPLESRVRFYNGTGIITGRTEMRGRIDGNAFDRSSRYTHVFIEQDGAWRLVSAHGTLIQTDPGPEKGQLKDVYVPATEQLVTEVVVKDIKRSTEFYCRMGFKLLRDGGDFVELTWENHRLFLAELSAFDGIQGVESKAPPDVPVANVRVMVPEVGDHWKIANQIGARIILPVSDRYYGLRDFTIADPDGFGIRFATVL